MTPAELFTLYPVALPLTAGLLGLLVGSFLNVVIARLPVMLERRWRAMCQEISAQPAAVSEERFDLVAPRSRCPHCNHAISVLENIPLLSFAWQKGKCAACGKSISWRYPAVELLTAVLSATIAWHFGFAPAAAGALFFTWALIALAFIDYDHKLLPDDITLPLMWGGLCFNLFATFVPLSSAVIGAAAGYVSLWSVYQLFRLITGKEGMGYGDFKLLAAFGAWLGWQALPIIILLSSAVGAIIGIGVIVSMGRDRSIPIPFGPFLCVAGLVALLWGDAITRAYLHYARFST